MANKAQHARQQAKLDAIIDNTQKQRFSKRTLLDYITLRQSQVQQTWDFDPGNGTAQITTRDRARRDEACLAYGAWDELNSLLEEFGL
jgi:hypothetical protein